MATPVLIPVEEYLRTTYRPDCDYIDGEVKERNLGETPHATVQSVLCGIFWSNRQAWGVRPFSEQRVQVKENNYRIPDVCVVRHGGPPGPIVASPPLICIEVLSPDDSLNGLRSRIDDYVRMGVPNIWMIDPVRRLAWTADASGYHRLESDEFSVPETPIVVSVSDLYRELDEMAAGR